MTTVWRRRFNRPDLLAKPKSDVAAQLASSPIVVVAIDLAEDAEPLHEALRVTAGQVLATLPAARLACLNILKLNRLSVDRTLDEEGRNKHIDRMVALQHWAQPLKLDASRLTVHVLEAFDPADALLEFADVNHVDHIVIGAGRIHSPARSWAACRRRSPAKRRAPSPWYGRRAGRDGWTCRTD